jgi:hypothetical protein
MKTELNLTVCGMAMTYISYLYSEKLQIEVFHSLSGSGSVPYFVILPACRFKGRTLSNPKSRMFNIGLSYYQSL